MSSRPSTSAGGLVVAAALLLILGIAVRAWLLGLATLYGFLGDHVDYVCWGRQAVAAGVRDLYVHPPASCLAEVTVDGSKRRILTGTGERLNYPPLAAYLFTLQGNLLQARDPDPLANTLTARTVYATSTAFAELLTALGIYALVRSFAGPWAAVAAFGATWLAPPLLIDGAFWGQTESWILAPGVWMVFAMTRGRWLAAGALWGIALALKPSGLIFAPLWLYAFLFRTARVRTVLAGVVALVVLNLLALPFWIDSGRTWLAVTYLDNFVYRLHWTTAMSFNVWYLDLLTTGILDPREPILGVARDVWGSILVATGLALAFALVRRWEHRNAPHADLGMLPLAALVTLAAILLPTRVHSTYGAFTAPFVIGTAFLVPRATLGAIACLVTISLQILSWQWGNLLAMHVQRDESVFPPKQRAWRQELRARDVPREWALTLANLAAAAAVAGGIAATRRARGRRGDPAA